MGELPRPCRAGSAGGRPAVAPRAAPSAGARGRRGARRLHDDACVSHRLGCEGRSRPAPGRPPPTEGTPMRWTLPQSETPTAWFNVLPRLKEPLPPPLHPATREPVGPDDLAPLFPMALIAQEMSTDPYIDIPGEVLDVLRLWRPTPLVRATRLEKALGTPARIYYKDESVSPACSHKPNTAVPQAFYNKAEGVSRLSTETGACAVGQRPLLRLSGLRARVQGLHVVLRTRSPTGGCSWRPGAARWSRPRWTSPSTPVRSGSRSATRSRTRVPTQRHPLLAGLGAQSRPPPPDRDRPGGAGPAQTRPRGPP